MAQKAGLTRGALQDFVAVSTLLYLLDPVRGKPTAYTLDKNPDSDGGHGKHQSRFLDSFALICSTARKGSETASAVCLEQDEHSTILRLSRNSGVPQDLIHRLQSVLEKLKLVASRGCATLQLEESLLYDVIEITKDKIRSLLEWICRPDVRLAVKSVMENLGQGTFSSQEDSSSNFRSWVSRLPVLASLAVDASPLTLIPHIKWACRARWVYSDKLTACTSSPGGVIPLWVNTIYKLGRYYAATQAMINFALRRPELFRSIRIEAVASPPALKFELKNKKALSVLLQKLCTNKDWGGLMSDLGRIWIRRDEEGHFRKDPEDHFRRKCKHTLVLHAEMQLLGFYDQHPKRRPQSLFMGTSKKACYLCEKFLAKHPLKMVVSASHQKIWPSWMPPPSSGPSTKIYEAILWNLKRDLEKTAARDLQGELGHRRPPNLDSTAGPPITFTDTFSTTHMTV